MSEPHCVGGRNTVCCRTLPLSTLSVVGQSCTPNESYPATNRSQPRQTVRSAISPAEISRQNISQLIASVNTIKDDVVARELELSEVRIENKHVE